MSTQLPKFSITTKVFMALLTAITVVATGMVMLARWQLNEGFLSYIRDVEQQQLESLATRLEQRFEEHGSWNFLQRNPRMWRRLVRESIHSAIRPSVSHDNPGRTPPPGEFRLHRRLSLLDHQRHWIAGSRRTQGQASVREIVVGADTVGWLQLAQLNRLRDRPELSFLGQQRGLLVWILVLTVATAALTAFLLSRYFISPIRALKDATDKLASGDLEKRIATNRTDEFGELARDFNRLAESLERNQQMRRQWIMDIAHELRTPLTVLKAEIEAVQDGVRTLTSQTSASLNNEVTRLIGLVEDLSLLSNADQGNLDFEFHETSLAELVSDVVNHHQNRASTAGLTLALKADQPCRAVVDSSRIKQVVTNLIDNAIKYTSRSGTIQVRVQSDSKVCFIIVEDSFPGVSTEDRERLFDRLFRVDNSRNRSTGGAGIGLSISKSIIEAHGGSITAAPSGLGGLMIRVTLPLQPGKQI
ncbi:MAG: ATP-binding protein [Pseudomonadota bacterium]